VRSCFEPVQASGANICLSSLCNLVTERYCDKPSSISLESCFEPVQAAAKERVQQLEAENKQLRQAASKRSEALAQARQFIDCNLQRSSAMLQGTADIQGNGVPKQSSQAGDHANK